MEIKKSTPTIIPKMNIDVQLIGMEKTRVTEIGPGTKFMSNCQLLVKQCTPSTCKLPMNLLD